LEHFVETLPLLIAEKLFLPVGRQALRSELRRKRKKK
jgi:hypothetical protein